MNFLDGLLPREIVHYITVAMHHSVVFSPVDEPYVHVAIVHQM